ncbi:MAG: class I SAM-dependent methyltransferase, partial [Parcubacteria group bacterium]|nr:class I SAM-dependent methyltransferase [Parcubacteria group bacterium]
GYDNIKKILRTFIPPQKRVLEVGCGTGDLLAALDPFGGVGVDVSAAMIDLARKRHPDPNLSFVARAIKDFEVNQVFDYIFMSDVIEHLGDVEGSIAAIARLMGPDTVFVNTMANPIWEPVLLVVEKLRLKMPEGLHERLTFARIKEMCVRQGIHIETHGYKLLCPVYIPFLSGFINKYLEPLFQRYAILEYCTARKTK